LITQYPDNAPAISPKLLAPKLPIINVLTADHKSPLCPMALQFRRQVLQSVPAAIKPQGIARSAESVLVSHQARAAL